MIDLDELDRLMQGRLRTTVEVYYEARRALLDASRHADAEEGLGIMLPMSRMGSADDVIEVSQWLVGPWVALVERSITLDEAEAQIAIMDDVSKAAQRESMMRWLASKRGSDTPALEQILIAAGRRFGMGDPAPWPGNAAWRNARDEDAEDGPPD